MQKILITLFSVGMLLSAANPAFANLRINEFSSYGSNDWIEIYNDGTDEIDLSGYRFRDSSATNKLDLTGKLGAKSFVAFDWGDKLNNGGDIIKLVLIADDTTVIDQVAYGTSGNDIAAPEPDKSAGRLSDNSSWVIFAAQTKGSSNSTSQVAPSPTSTPVPTATPTKVPTPTKSPTATKAPTATKSPTATKIPTTSKSDPAKTVKSAVTQATPAGQSEVIAVSSKEAKQTAANNQIQSVEAEKSQQKNKGESKTVLVKSEEKDKIFIAIVIFGALCLIACAILLFRKGEMDKLNA